MNEETPIKCRHNVHNIEIGNITYEYRWWSNIPSVHVETLINVHCLSCNNLYTRTELEAIIASITYE